MDFETSNPEEAQALIKKLELRHKELETANRAQDNFLDFVRAVWPEFISGYHHQKIAEKFELIKDKKLKRLIVNMPPRHTKSEFASYLTMKTTNASLQTSSYHRIVKQQVVGKQTKVVSTSQLVLVVQSRVVVQTS